MTCREKLKTLLPGLSPVEFENRITAVCPSMYDILPDPSDCDHVPCSECWDREIPETNDRAVNIPEDIVKAEEKSVRKTNKTKILCISGHAQNGKDTTAGILRDLLEVDGHKVLIAHYGDLVKYVCKTFFRWDGNKDEVGRSILQRVGTDVVRAQRPNYWVDFVVGILQMFPNEWSYVLIPDCRFPNEIDSLKGAGFDVTHIRVIRAPFVSPLTPEQQMHPSETALDGVKADIYVPNFGRLSDLVTEIEDRVIPFIDEEAK